MHSACLVGTAQWLEYITRIALVGFLRNEPGNVLLEPGKGHLSRQSVVVVSQVSTVDKDRRGETIGALSSAAFHPVILFQHHCLTQRPLFVR